MKGACNNSRVLMISLSLLVAAVPAIAGHKLQKEERRTVNVADQSNLIVRSDQGKVVVVGMDDLTKIKIFAQKWVRARDEEEAQEIMDALGFEVEEGTYDITIVARRPAGIEKKRSVLSLLKGERVDAFVDFTIEVPRDFSVKAATTSGDVRITNIKGKALVNATSGDVVLREIGEGSIVKLTSGKVNAVDLGGDLKIAASSGNAEVRRVKGVFVMEATSGSVEAFEIGGDAQVRLFNGDLVLSGCLGNLDFTTANGDAHIVDVLGNINACSSSGDLDVMIIPVGEKEFILNTSSGNVKLHYMTPQAYGFLLDVNTCTGSIRGDLDIRLDKITRQTLKGIVGSGKSKVIVETSSGNVEIQEQKEKK